MYKQAKTPRIMVLSGSAGGDPGVSGLMVPRADREAETCE